MEITRLDHKHNVTVLMLSISPESTFNAWYFVPLELPKG